MPCTSIRIALTVPHTAVGYLRTLAAVRALTARVLQYYDLPRLSWRALTWEPMVRGREGWNITDLMEEDERHPTDFGHRWCPRRQAEAHASLLQCAAFPAPLVDCVHRSAHMPLRYIVVHLSSDIVHAFCRDGVHGTLPRTEMC